MKGSVKVADEERDDLRATAENIVDDAERLKQIELRKLQLESLNDDSEAKRLASEAEQLAEEIADKAHAEKDLADQVASDGK
jgi:hypothetical protein